MEKSENNYANGIKAKPFKSGGERPEPDPELELNACSMYDCTGLIPSAVTDEGQEEAYEKLYPFLPPAAQDGGTSTLP